MTWSIVARDKDTGAFGIGVATRFFAVGALCPHGRGGVGALATQALINPLYGPDGVALLARGMPADAVVATLTAADPGAAARQLHVIDAAGRIARHTGADCVGWCGGLDGDNFSVAGNMLAGADVIAASHHIMTMRGDLALPDRLLAALKAGEAAGGDKRGRQSAALRIYSTEEYPDLDLRVDDHGDPLSELGRLLGVAREYYVHFRQFLPTRSSPGGVFDRSTINREIGRLTQT